MAAPLIRNARIVIIKAGDTLDFVAMEYYVLRASTANAPLQVSEDLTTFVDLPLNKGHRYTNGGSRAVRFKNPNAFDVTATIEVGQGEPFSERVFANTGDLAAVARRFGQTDLTKVISATVASGGQQLCTQAQNVHGMRVKRLAWFLTPDAVPNAGMAKISKTIDAPPSEAGPMDFSVTSGLTAVSFGHSDREIEFPPGTGVKLVVSGGADAICTVTFELL
jgi:hypothetical protein